MSHPMSGTPAAAVMPWADYRFVQDALPADDGDWVHLHSLAIAGLLFDARNAYITDGLGIPWQHMLDGGHIMLTRHLEIDFRHETRTGVPLKVGVRAARRTRRTLIFHEAVWRADIPTTVALANSVQLMASRDGSGAIALPEDLVERIESYEVRRLPWAAERTR